VLLHQREFFFVQLAGLFEDAVVHSDLADVVKQSGDAQVVEILGIQREIFSNDHGVLRDAAGMASRVGILFVNRGGEHADGAQEQVAIFSGGLFQALDVLFDVAGHMVESFGELGDFGGSADFHAFVKFGAADGANRKDKSLNRLRDPDGEKISDNKSHDGYAHDEAQSTGGEFVDSGVDASLVQAALRDHGPVQLRNSAVGADHFNGMLRIAPSLREVHCFGGAQFLRQLLKMFHHRRIRGDVAAGNHVSRIRVRDDMAMAVNDEDDAIANAGVADSGEQAVDGYDGSKHAGELAVGGQRDGHDERGTAALS